MMLDYLLAADLLILTVTQLLLVWACFDYRKYREEFAKWMQVAHDDLATNATEYGAILEDIASALESSGGGAGPSIKPTQTGGGFPEILSNLLMARMSMGGEYAESKEEPVGSVSKGRNETETE